MTNKLEQCPCCEAEAVLDHVLDIGDCKICRVRCTECAMTTIAAREHMVIAAWNNRPKLDKPANVVPFMPNTNPICLKTLEERN